MNGEFGSLKVLLADDDLLVRRVVGTLLEKSGHDVDVAVDGKDAAGKLASTAYGLLLLDIQMPHRTGVELLEDLRARDDRTPVVIMSSALTGTIRERCARSGRVICVDKPVNRSILDSAISSVLRLS